MGVRAAGGRSAGGDVGLGDLPVGDGVHDDSSASQSLRRRGKRGVRVSQEHPRGSRQKVKKNLFKITSKTNKENLVNITGFIAIC